MFGRRRTGEAKARKLRDKAARARERGRDEQALACYLELEALEPTEPDWPRRAAECYRRLGRSADEVRALLRAMDGLAQGGFVVKAIALGKRVMALEPGNEVVRGRLDELTRQRSLGLARLPVRARAVSEKPGGDLGSSRAAPLGAGEIRVEGGSRSIPPGAPLEAVALAEVAPSRPSEDLPTQSVPVYEIDLSEVEWVDDTEADAERARQAARAVRRHTPLFSDVSDRSFAELVERISLREVAPGEAIVREGESADALYVIAEGRVEVVRPGPPRVRCSELAEGDFFGEIGLLADTPRTRTVVALEPTQLLVLDRDTVAVLADRESSFLRVLLRFVRERLVARLLGTHELFAPFGEARRHELVERFRFLELEPGTVLIQEGQRSEGLFVLLSGEAEVLQGEAVLARLEVGAIFGEMSLLTQQPAVGTVRTRRKSFALMMPRASFAETVMVEPHVLMVASELAERRRGANEQQSSAIADGRLEIV